MCTAFNLLHTFCAFLNMVKSFKLYKETSKVMLLMEFLTYSMVKLVCQYAVPDPIKMLTEQRLAYFCFLFVSDFFPRFCAVINWLRVCCAVLVFHSL